MGRGHSSPIDGTQIRFVLREGEQARDEEWSERKRGTFERVKQKGRERIDSVH